MSLQSASKRRLGALAASALVVGWARPARAEPDRDANALHVLNRLSYGPAPGDLARIRRTGIDRYIDEQLHPEQIALSPGFALALKELSTTQLSQRELVARFRDAGQAAKNDNEQGKAVRRGLYQQVTLEAGEARLLGAIQSPRQLQEQMVDFWFNHFNVFIGKGLDRVLVENYEREAIRPHAMGRFRDLLGATAHHPAMLFYLDNWLSTAPGFQPRRAAGPLAKASGLNENYARELMELHTLGVDGGYGQKDVTELARILTGWTLNPRLTEGPSIFYFDAARHDDGDKQWLGRHVGARGVAEGEFALDVLAAHPATARHVAFGLAQYFVADTPPAALVERLGSRYLETDGNIAAVLKTLFASAEFRDPAVHAKKFKTPYQFVVSCVRATDLPISNVRPLLAALNGLGQPLYGCQTPDGYKNTEQAWLNPDAVTRRIDFATAFASGKLPFARPLDPANPADTGRKAMQRAADQLDGDARYNPNWRTDPVDAQALLATLGASIGDKTRGTVAGAEPLLRAAMVLGSPDFMHR